MNANERESEPGMEPQVNASERQPEKNDVGAKKPARSAIPIGLRHEECCFGLEGGCGD